MSNLYRINGKDYVVVSEHIKDETGYWYLCLEVEIDPNLKFKIKTGNTKYKVLFDKNYALLDDVLKLNKYNLGE